MVRGNHWWVIPGTALLLGLMLTQLWPAAVQAQCGTQASSCKNCHEVQAKDAINNQGAWHVDHAFGDFCEFCHAGNVQAKDKAAAHQGLVAWNADVKASCASCHTADYEKMAQTYAATLGVQVNSGHGTGAAQPSTALTATTACAPLGGEEIDFNLLYAQQEAPPPLVSNWGNLILGMMTLGLGTVFFGTVWTWEGWGRKIAAWIRNNVSPVPKAVAEASRRGNHPEDSAQDGGQKQ